MWYMTEDRELIRSTAREFAEKEVAPFVAQMEKGEYPIHLVKRMGQLGLTGLPWPESMGGSGNQWVTYGIVMEEICKVNAALGLIMLLNTAIAGGPIALAGTPEQQSKWIKPCFAGDVNIALSMTEPSGIFNFPDYQSRAVKDGNDWIINAAKIFTTSAGHSDIYVACAMTSDFDPATYGGLSMFVVPADTPGFKVGHIEHKLGWNGSATGETFYSNCRVPDANRIGPVGGGVPILLQVSAWECMCFGAMCLGGAEAVYDKAVKYTKERLQMGKSLFVSHQVLRNKLAELWLEIETLRGYTYMVMEMVDQGKPCMPLQFAAKIKGAAVMERVCSEAMVLFGGNGVIVEYDIERFYRDAKVNAIGGGSVASILETVSNMI